MKRNALDLYTFDRNSLSKSEIEEMFKEGMRLGIHTEIAQTLADGGSALFPHVSIKQCGHQTASVVQACLLACKKSGKNKILVIGVMHALTDRLKEARKREKTGEDLTGDPFRGLFGPKLPNKEFLEQEFCLDNFIFLLKAAAEREGIKLPEIILRYPHLIRLEPQTIPGIEDLELLAKESIVVGTADFCHHGLAYGHSMETCLPISDEAVKFARESIEQGLRFLSQGALAEYRSYCYKTLSDAIEVGQLLRHLLGSFEGIIRDLKIADVSRGRLRKRKKSYAKTWTVAEAA